MRIRRAHHPNAPFGIMIFTSKFNSSNLVEFSSITVNPRFISSDNHRTLRRRRWRSSWLRKLALLLTLRYIKLNARCMFHVQGGWWSLMNTSVLMMFLMCVQLHSSLWSICIHAVSSLRWHWKYQLFLTGEDDLYCHTGGFGMFIMNVFMACWDFFTKVDAPRTQISL